jgi:hypothetical protein
MVIAINFRWPPRDHRQGVAGEGPGGSGHREPCLEIIQNSEVINRIQIINGLKEGNIMLALNGKHVGTIIRKS